MTAIIVSNDHTTNTRTKILLVYNVISTKLSKAGVLPYFRPDLLLIMSSNNHRAVLTVRRV